MALRADTVDGNPCCLELLDQVHQSRGLCVGAVEVVVVDVELCTGVCGPGSVECDGDEFLAEHVGEDGGSEGPVFVEDLVDDVPAVDFALVPRHDGGDVVLNDVG